MKRLHGIARSACMIIFHEAERVATDLSRGDEFSMHYDKQRVLWGVMTSALNALHDMGLGTQSDRIKLIFSVPSEPVIVDHDSEEFATDFTTLS